MKKKSPYQGREITPQASNHPPLLNKEKVTVTFLSTAALIEGTILCMHGGLSPDLHNLEQVSPFPFLSYFQIVITNCSHWYLTIFRIMTYTSNLSVCVCMHSPSITNLLLCPTDTGDWTTTKCPRLWLDMWHPLGWSRWGKILCKFIWIYKINILWDLYENFWISGIP